MRCATTVFHKSQLPVTLTDPRDVAATALYTKLDAKCDEQVTVVGLLLTTLGHVYHRQVLSGGHTMAKCFSRFRVWDKVPLPDGSILI